jgi:hypothetical protein
MKTTLIKALRAALLLTAGLLITPTMSQATPLNLDFSNTSTPTNAVGAFGPYHYGVSSLLYTGVVTTGGGVNVDARVTTSVWGTVSLGVGANSGLYSNYSQSEAEPNRDAGIYFTADSLGVGGVHYDMEFFVAGTTTPVTLDAFALMLYDIDGDSRDGTIWQYENAAAYIADGFTSYRLLTGDSQLMPSAIPGGMKFQGTTVNWPELNTNGAVILNFENTSKIRLDFSSNTFGGLPNGSFIGIDGDVSFAEGDFSEYTPTLPAPEPSTVTLLSGLAALGLTARRRL